MDESGTVDAGDTFVVAGVVVDSEAEDRLAGLRADIHEILPWLPWPLHASELNNDAMHFAWAMNRRDVFRDHRVGQSVGGHWDALLQAAARSKAAIAAVTNPKLNGRSGPDWMKHAVAIGAELRSASTHSAWKAVADEVRERLMARIASVVASLSNDGLAFAVVAAHGERTQLSDFDYRSMAGMQSLAAKTRPWNRVAGEAVARASDLLGRNGGTVQLHPRPLDVAGSNNADQSNLVPYAVHLLTASGQRPPSRASYRLSAPLEKVVVLHAASASAFDRKATVGHVLADILSNLSRRELKRSTVRVDDVNLVLQRRTGLKLGFRQRLPGLVAAGEAAIRLSEVRTGAASPSLTRPQADWALEQLEACRAVGLQKWGL